MTNDLSETVQSELDALRRDYVTQLARRIAEIDVAWHAAVKASDRMATQYEVAQLAHSLAGTAGVLGLLEVSRAAATLEEALEQGPDAAQRDPIDPEKNAGPVESALKQLIRVGAKVTGSRRSP